MGQSGSHRLVKRNVKAAKPAVSQLIKAKQTLASRSQHKAQTSYTISTRCETPQRMLVTNQRCSEDEIKAKLTSGRSCELAPLNRPPFYVPQSPADHRCVSAPVPKTFAVSPRRCLRRGEWDRCPESHLTSSMRHLSN